MISDSKKIILILIMFGFTVSGSISDFRQRSHTKALNNGFITNDFTADNKTFSTKHVDIIDPVNSSYNQANEHGMRNRRANDGNQSENANDDKLKETTINVDAVTPSSTSNSITDDSSFEEYFAEFLKKNPDVQVLRSPFPFDNQNKEWTLNVKGGKNIEVLIHLLDINPFSNHLSIKAGHEQNNEYTAIKIAGPISQKNVQKLIVLDTQEFIVIYQFANSESSKYKGFVLTYKSIGEMDQNDLPNANVTIPFEQYSHIKILLDVPKARQNNETMAQLRLLFAQSANKFIAAEKLPIEKCKIGNVKFVDVLRCPLTWPNSESCIQIDLTIPLKTIANVSASNAKNNSSVNKSGEDLDHKKIEYELTVEHLRKMWISYGRPHFMQNEFQEFTPPNTRNLLLVWTAISLSVVIAFLLVLYGIWKIDLLKDYRRMHWKISDQNQICKQSEIDISMFPSPHQTVPTLFPNDISTYTTAPTTGGGLPYEYMNQPISFSQSDFKRRGSLEESMKLDDSAIEKHEAGVVPFQSEIIDFNEPHAEDEITFSRATGDSPRSQIKFRVSGNNDSIS